MEKIQTKHVVGSILKRVLYPQHISKAIRLQRQKKYTARAFEDPQLKLYGEILPGGFLHYGYFDDPDIAPQDMSLNDISHAQRRYAELIVEQVVDRDSLVLDIGCGMGGITKMMMDAGMCPVALSPDKHQIRHIKNHYPGVPTIESKFESMPLEQRQQKYGTVITAESLQYLDLDAALPLMETLLKPGGRWIACDYFRLDAVKVNSEKWENFEKRIENSGFRFVSQRDITPHIMPTSRYAHMWGNDIGRPIVNFCFDKVQTKHPGAHYVLEEVIATLNQRMTRELEVMNPATFAAKSKYMLLVLEKKPV